MIETYDGCARCRCDRVPKNLEVLPMNKFWLLISCGLLVVTGFANLGLAQEDEVLEITLSDKEIGRLDIF